MVRKMLKAFIKVTADKTHFAIHIKILTIVVYHFIFCYNPPEYNIKVMQLLLYSISFTICCISLPIAYIIHIYQFTDTCTAPIKPIV